LEAGLIGALWGFGTLIEVGFFLALSRVERRVAPEWLVLAGGLAAMVRWTAYAFAPPLAWLWPLQGLHALTFAASHLGAMRIVYEEAPQEASGFAGAIYAAVAGGTLLGLSTVGSGWLEQRFGAAGYGAMAILAACGFAATVVLVVSRRSGLGPASAPRAIAAPLGAEAEPRAAELESTPTEQAKAEPIRRAQ
jgi:PPP family 3-phenylpropionic acid transporter